MIVIRLKYQNLKFRPRAKNRRPKYFYEYGAPGHRHWRPHKDGIHRLLPAKTWLEKTRWRLFYKAYLRPSGQHQCSTATYLRFMSRRSRVHKLWLRQQERKRQQGG